MKVKVCFHMSNEYTQEEVRWTPEDEAMMLAVGLKRASYAALVERGFERVRIEPEDEVSPEVFMHGWQAQLVREYYAGVQVELGRAAKARIAELEAAVARASDGAERALGVLSSEPAEALLVAEYERGKRDGMESARASVKPRAAVPAAVPERSCGKACGGQVAYELRAAGAPWAGMPVSNALQVAKAWAKREVKPWPPVVG